MENSTETKAAVTVDDLRAQVARIAELRDFSKEIGNTKKLNDEILDEEERKMLAMLEEANLKSFRSELGLVSASHRKSVATPKTPEDRDAFRKYLESVGMFETMWSVNSQTLNSYYKTEFEKAVEKGEEDFSLPGISGETITPILMFKRV